MTGNFFDQFDGHVDASPAPPAPNFFDQFDAVPHFAAGASDTVQNDPLAATMPNPDYARSQPVAHTGFAAQVARTMSGNGPDLMAPPQTSPIDFARGASETAVTGIPGIPGDTEAFARLVMSPFGVSRQTLLPTTGDIANDIFGAPQNSTEAAGRAVGSFVSPLMAAGLARGAASAGRAIARIGSGPSADSMALDAIHKFSGGPIQIDPRQIIPGSEPTLVEATVDNSNLPGVANLQRTMRNLDPTGQIQQREIANAQARTNFVNQLTGTPADIKSAQLARDAVTDPMREAAFANAGEADSSGVNRVINQILASPAGQRDAVVSNLQNVQSKLQVDNPLSQRISDARAPIQDAITSGTLGPQRLADFSQARLLLTRANRGAISEDDLVSGLSALAKRQKVVGPIDNALSVIKSGPTAFESDPEQLYGIRKSINDQLETTGPQTSSDARLATSELLTVRDALDDAIEKAAPGYDAYRAKYAELSQPVNQMQYLQSLGLTDARGNLTLAKVKGALDNINKLQQKPGLNGAKSLTGDQIASLQMLHDDLYHASNLSLGRAVGSDTVQNVAGANALQNMLPGRIGALAGKYMRPEVAGATIGSLLGTHFGIEGSAAGASIGAGLGNILERSLAAKNAAITNSIQDMVLNPVSYQTAALRAANASQVPGAIGNAGVGSIPFNPVIRALLAQRAALTLAPPPSNLGR